MINNRTSEEEFVLNGSKGRDLPIPIFSIITLQLLMLFLLHLMIMCGQCESELHIKECLIMRESLAKVKLIGLETDEDSL